MAFPHPPGIARAVPANLAALIAMSALPIELPDAVFHILLATLGVMLLGVVVLLRGHPIGLVLVGFAAVALPVTILASLQSFGSFREPLVMSAIVGPGVVAGWIAFVTFSSERGRATQRSRDVTTR